MTVIDHLDSPQPWWKKRFPALRHRSFRMFLSGHLVSVIGSWMQQYALLWYVQTLKRDVGSDYWLGVTMATASLPIVLFSPIGGALADRLSRRWLIVGTQSVSMLLALVFSVLVWMDQAPFPVVLVFAALNGLVMANDIPARQAFAVEMVGRQDLLSGIALNSAVFNVGRLLGPAAAGIVITSVGMAGCFFLNALSFLGVILALIRMPLYPMPKEDEGERKAGSGILEGFRILAADRKLVGFVITLALVLFTGGSYLTLMPALAEGSLGLDAAGYSILLSFNGLGSLIGALFVATRIDLSSRRPVMIGGICLLGTGLVIAGKATSLFLACFGLVIAGGGFVAFLASTNSMVQLSVSDSVRGRIMSIWVLVFGASQPIGSYAAGWIAYRVGTAQTIVFEGIACFVAAGYALTVLRQHREP